MEIINNPIIIISGPTASGKTTLSISLAKSLGDLSEIINFDSLLFYKELNIGTAKPSEVEQENIVHHLISNRSISDPYNASDFCDDAKKIIEVLHQGNKIPILVGGSGFYIRALLKGMFPQGSISEETKREVSNIIKTKGFTGIRDFLKEHDQDSYQSLHENDEYRNIRAIEYYIETKSPISEIKNKFNENAPYDFTTKLKGDWNVLHLHLDLDKEEHLNIIRNRTKKMIEDGLVQELSQILKSNYTGQEKALSSIGYKETLQFLKGEIESIEDLKERISISTRQLAKAQRTFFKKSETKIVLNPLKDKQKMIKLVKDFVFPRP